MPKENQRVALSKRMLKEGLIGLLKKKNIREISVNELCQVAEINRTTFYRHYQTVHDVLQGLLDRRVLRNFGAGLALAVVFKDEVVDIEADYASLAQQKPLPSTARNDLQKHALYLCKFLEEHKAAIKLFLQNSTDSDVAVIYQQYFGSSLASGQLLYKGRPASQEIMQLMNSFFAYGSYAIIRQWILEDIPLAPEEVADLLAGSFNQDFTFQ